MSPWQLSDDDIVLIIGMLNAGKSAEEVANSLHISLQMVACAVRKWPYMKTRVSSC